MIGNRPSRGFSLLELALVLTILGFLMIMVFSLSSKVSTMQAITTSADPVQRGTDALAGFVVMNDRLPCPDTGGSGVENCGAKYGGFPWKTVGLAQPLKNARGFDLAYGVYRNSGVNADLAVKTSAYVPSFLNSPAAPTLYNVNVNGLDFCEKLRTGGNTPYANTEVGAKVLNYASVVNPAFLLADPGNANADGAGGVFDGSNNSGLTWESPALHGSLTYDDQVQAISFYQLAARLDCPAVIARVSGAVRDANAAYDIKRVYDFIHDYRVYNLDVANKSKDLAYAQDIIADFNLALTAAMVVTDIAITLSSASGAVAGAISAINGAIAVAMAIVGKWGGPGGAPPGSAANYASAQAAVVVATTELANSVTAQASANAALTAAVTEAQNRDARGWFQ